MGYQHRRSISDDEFDLIVRAVEDLAKTRRYGKYFESVLDGDIRSNLLDLCKEICDEISRVKGYSRGMWVSLVHRHVYSGDDVGKVFFVYHQLLDLSLDPTVDKKGARAREATYLFGTAQTITGKVYYNSFPELVMKCKLGTLGDGAVIK